MLCQFRILSLKPNRNFPILRSATLWLRQPGSKKIFCMKGQIKQLARREILQKQEEEIVKAFEIAKKELTGFHKKEAYSKVLTALIVEAGTSIGGGNLVVKFRKEDKSIIKDFTAIAKKITTNSGNKCTIKTAKDTITAIGGVVVQTEDKAISIYNTFDARLDQKYRIIRNKIASELFAVEKS